MGDCARCYGFKPRGGFGTARSAANVGAVRYPLDRDRFLASCLLPVTAVRAARIQG